MGGSEACLNMVVPSSEGYGKLGMNMKVKPYSTLDFDICILQVQVDPFPKFNLFEHLDVDKDGFLTEEEMLPFFTKVGDGKVPDDVWEVEDKDKDRLISRKEWAESTGEPLPPPGEDKENESKTEL